MIKKENQKLIALVGPTAVGKTDLSIKIALWLASKKSKQKFNIEGAEIVSADSRQVYKGMDIGTGKITKEEMQGIPHHLIDVALPTEQFTVAKYKKLALEAINKIFNKNKIPLLVGGTGFYVQAVVKGLKIPQVKPDWELREKLSKKSEKDLFKMLKKKDPRRSKNIDKNNKRRLVRALEIIEKTGQPVPPIQKKQPQFDTLIIGVERTRKELKKMISKRTKRMIKKGLEEEVKELVKKYNWIPLLQTIGYQEWKDYFDNKITKEEVQKLIKKNTIHFAKRQETWFKRNKNIHWIKNYRQTKKLTREFLH